MIPVRRGWTHFCFSILLSSISVVLAGCAHDTKHKTASTTTIASLVATAKTNSAAGEPILAPDLATNPPPRITSLNSNLPTIFVAGDSTAARGQGANQQGWGVLLAQYFDPAKVNFANRARGGRSSRTYITEGLWDQLLANVKRGDVVLIQLGENDGGEINDASRARGSIRGLGEETQEIDNQVTHKHEIVHTYGWYLRKMMADTKAKGATPIVLTVTVRNIWKNGKVERGAGNYREWAYQTARAEHVMCIDVASAVADRFDEMGEDAVTKLYPRDHTHFNAIGADIHAVTIVALLKGLRLNAVEGFLSDKGKAVEADRLSWLQLPHPANLSLPTLFLVGDSTVRNGRGDGAGDQWGWGDEIAPFFDTSKINVVNRAVGGTTGRTFYRDFWPSVLTMLKPGDFVIMQFGTNTGPVNDAARARGTLHGIGDDTQEITNQVTKKFEVVHSFGWYEKQMIAEARSKGAMPMVCSLIPRNNWRNGRTARSNGDDVGGWARETAKAVDAPFIDLNEVIARQYDELGQEKVKDLFVAGAGPHTSLAGAQTNAACVIVGLKALSDDPLVSFFQTKHP